MDSTAASEEFPGLYRAILDGVAELERVGQRAEAHRIRQAATRTYSGPWGEQGRRRLTALTARIERILAGPDGIAQRPVAGRRIAGRRIAVAPLLVSLVRRLPTPR